MYTRYDYTIRIFSFFYRNILMRRTLLSELLLSLVATTLFAIRLLLQNKFAVRTSLIFSQPFVEISYISRLALQKSRLWGFLLRLTKTKVNSYSDSGLVFFIIRNHSVLTMNNSQNSVRNSCISDCRTFSVQKLDEIIAAYQQLFDDYDSSPK